MLYWRGMPKKAQHLACRTAVQGQQIAGSYPVKCGMVRVDTEQAKARLLIVPHVKRRAFGTLFDQPLERRKYALLKVVNRLKRAP